MISIEKNLFHQTLGSKTDLPGKLELPWPWQSRMGTVKGLCTDLPERSLINGQRMTAADKSVIHRNDRVLPFKTVAFCGDVQKGVDDQCLLPDLFPERRRRFDEPLLKESSHPSPR